MEEIIILSPEDSDFLLENTVVDEIEIRIPMSHLKYFDHNQTEDILSNITQFLNQKKEEGFVIGKRIDDDRHEIVFFSMLEY